MSSKKPNNDHLNKVKHIYFFSHCNPTGISTRYRGKYVLHELEKTYPITYSLIYPSYSPRAVIRFAKNYLEILLFRKKKSVVIFQKLHKRTAYTRLLKLLLKRQPNATIYDTDDADYLRYSSENIHFYMKNSSACTIGSNSLKKYTSKHNSTSHLLTSPVISHPFIKKKRNKTLHIGWIGHYGSSSEIEEEFQHRTSLKKLLFPALRNIRFDIKLSILGVTREEDVLFIKNYFKNQSNIQLNIPTHINWLDEQDIYRQLCTFDIGLSPMVSNEFNEAKSAFKLKQYLSCGVPVLSSPVGENNTFLKNGVNGFHCNSSEDFTFYIQKIHAMNEQEYSDLLESSKVDCGEFSMNKYATGLMKLMTNLVG